MISGESGLRPSIFNEERISLGITSAAAISLAKKMAVALIRPAFAQSIGLEAALASSAAMPGAPTSWPTINAHKRSGRLDASCNVSHIALIHTMLDISYFERAKFATCRRLLACLINEKYVHAYLENNRTIICTPEQAGLEIKAIVCPLYSTASSTIITSVNGNNQLEILFIYSHDIGYPITFESLSRAVPSSFITTLHPSELLSKLLAVSRVQHISQAIFNHLILELNNSVNIQSHLIPFFDAFQLVYFRLDISSTAQAKV